VARELVAPRDFDPTDVSCGQKRTSGTVLLMSALPLKADIDERNCRVRFVPKAEIGGLIE
jgi:hypothetical protein